jgi:hypothetical protein
MGSMQVIKCLDTLYISSLKRDDARCMLNCNERTMFTDGDTAIARRCHAVRTQRSHRHERPMHEMQK